MIRSKHARADGLRTDRRSRRALAQILVGDALGAALDDIEHEYRKLGTNLLAKEVAQDLTPKNGT